MVIVVHSTIWHDDWWSAWVSVGARFSDPASERGYWDWADGQNRWKRVSWLEAPF